MVVKGLVQYRGGIAHYYINQEHEGIYKASLVRYDGRMDHYPPYVITLIRSATHWSGSIDEIELLNGLGRIIDTKVQKDAGFREQPTTKPVIPKGI
jgi:hypothetical protein